MLALILGLVITILVSYLLYKLSTKNFGYFEEMRMKYSKPIPALGINGWIFKKNKSMSDLILEIYNEFSTERVFGAFDFTKPIFVLRDLDLVKHITIKDFFHFQDHRAFINTDVDEFFGNMLPSMKGKQWRDMRSSLSPLFTGSKMRVMFQLITHCANQLTDHIQTNKNEPFRMKDMLSRYTNDVIASCAFGVECNSLANKNDHFYQIGQEFLAFQKTLQIMKLTFIRFCPKLAKPLGIKIFSPNVKEVFFGMMNETIKVRKEQGIKRPDMMNWLMSLKEGDFSVYDDDSATVEAEKALINGEIKRNWTDIELIAQTFIFFLAGFETSSTAMQFIFYELALNPDVQDKLIQEIDETNTKLNGVPFDYEVMKTMSYLSMVINESLRKWPPAPVLDRMCVQDYTYEGEDGFELKIREDDMVWIPIYGFHMDPKYFPNPKKFDPERFSKDNTENNLDAFMPFGIGPRNCIGFRFALMEMKAILYYIFLKFRVDISKETQVPLKLKKSMFSFIPEKEIKLKFVPRTKVN